jgi:hypothetical protein
LVLNKDFISLSTILCTLGLELSKNIVRAQMRGILLAVLLNLVAFQAFSQFWFGPKIGGQLTTHKYQEPLRLDTFNVESDFNFHTGIVFEYQTPGMFAVHTELTYMQVKTKSTSPFDSAMSASATHHFLTVPMLARAVFGRGPLKFFVNGGPRLSYWMSGKGDVYTSDFEENASPPMNYKVGFGEASDFEGSSDNYQVMSKPNRIQYSLDFGGGVIFDISEEQRILLDIRYSFGHSIMGFNSGNSFNNINNGRLSEGGYTEDMEYQNSMFMFSVAYLMGYSPTKQRRGQSTSTIKRK